MVSLLLLLLLLFITLCNQQLLHNDTLNQKTCLLPEAPEFNRIILIYYILNILIIYHIVADLLISAHRVLLSQEFI